MMIAIVSPMARPTPRITPARMPDLAAGICTLKIVPICVLPNARDASLYEGGTASNAFCATLMIVGKIIMARIEDNGQQAIPIGPTGKQRPQAGHDHPHAEKTEDDGGNACEQFYRWADNTTQPAGCKLREEDCG